MRETLKRFLREVSLFSDLSDDELEVLVDVATEAHYPKDSRIVREGDPGGSLLIVVSGQVSIVLERPAAEPVELARFRRGEFFGEMSLFDGKPRSATAVAKVDSHVIEIGAEAFKQKITRNAQVPLKILGEIASRIRQTDSTVRDLADQVYRQASSALKASLDVQLDAVKTIYQKTEERASQTLERASQTVGHMERMWSLLTTKGLPILGVVLAVAGFLGFRSYQDLEAVTEKVRMRTEAVKKLTEEVKQWHREAKRDVTALREARAQLDVMKETTLELRHTREMAEALARRTATPQDLRRAAQNYEQEKKRLFERYFFDPQAGIRYEKFEADVVREAVDVFVALVSAARDLSARDAEHLLGALLFVLKSPGDAGAAGARWREERQVRELFQIVGASVEGPRRKATLDDLKRLLESPQPRMRQNTALILADFEERDAAVMDILDQTLADDHEGAWRRAASAIARARLGERPDRRPARDYLTQQLEQPPDVAYPAAAQLAQLERSKLKALAEQMDGPTGFDALHAKLRHAIDKRAPANCFEQRYAAYLVACLDDVDGNCRDALGKALGVECSARR